MIAVASFDLKIETSDFYPLTVQVTNLLGAVVASAPWSRDTFVRAGKVAQDVRGSIILTSTMGLRFYPDEAPHVRKTASHYRDLAGLPTPSRITHETDWLILRGEL